MDNRAGRGWRDSKRALALAAVGFAAWILLLGARLMSVPVDWWRWRDDAVITLSHAQNLVQFGSIGVSPGDRVEGFSSPLQFLLSALYFFLTRRGYGSFLDLQVVLCIGLTGAFVALALDRVLAGWPGSEWRRGVIALGLAALAGLLTAASWTATGWLASGMENPLATVIGAAILFVVSLRPKRLTMLCVALLVALLGLVRVEFPPLVLPLAAGLAFSFLRQPPVAGRRFAVASVLLIPVATWLLVGVGRWAYFGDLLPNTALVQDKSTLVGQKALALMALYGVYGWLVRTFMRSRVPARGLSSLWLGFGLAAMGAAVGLSGFRGDPLLGVYVTNLVALMGCLAAVQFLNGRGGSFEGGLDVVQLGLLFIPVSQFLVMGGARMEAARVLSLATPWMAIWVALSLARLVSASGPWMWTPRRGVLAGLVLMPSLAVLAASAAADRPRKMPWIVSPRELHILSALQAFRARHLAEDALVLVANPDLGKISFPKQAVMTDLGLLGDPLLARLRKWRPDLAVLYLNEVARPDIVQVHRSWSCRYTDWLSSSAFLARHRLTDPAMATAGPLWRQGCPLGGRYGIWETQIPPEERRLTLGILRDPDPVAAIEQAVQVCRAQGESPFRCSSVVRAMQRGYRRLRRDGLLDRSVQAIRLSPGYALESELLRRGSGWGQRAFEQFVRLAGQQGAGPPVGPR